MEKVNKNIIPKEERESLILEAVERALKVLPDTVGSLLMDHVAMNKINTEFYKNHPEFRNHKESVVSVLEKMDGENPLLDYKDLLGKAVPEIRRRIETAKSLDVTGITTTPDRTYKSLNAPKVKNPHGEL